MPYRTIPYTHTACTNTARRAQPYEDTRRACSAQRTIEHKEYIYHTAVPTPKVCIWEAEGVEKSITNKGNEAFYDWGSPWFFWGSSLQELHTSPENWLRQKSDCIPMNNPTAQVYKSFFESRLALRRLGIKKLRHSESIWAEMCYLYRRTRQMRLKLNHTNAVCFTLSRWTPHPNKGNVVEPRGSTLRRHEKRMPSTLPCR